MKNKNLFSFFAIVVLFTPCLLAYDDDVPHEAKGFQKSGYSLSQYENINLSNGNLTYHIPLYTLRTDGGLTYPLTAYYNMKTWRKHQYCTLSSDGYSSCSYDELPGGGIHSVTVADGTETYGFGWDLRPARLTGNGFGNTFQNPVLVDASGARHHLKDTPPWNSGTIPPDTKYTTDGTNYRFTTISKEGTGENAKATKVRLEDGHGTVYIFAHIVPEACNANMEGINTSDEPGPFNFHANKTGLYLSEIQRGPWINGTQEGGDPTNKIVFTYVSTASSYGETCTGQWRLSKIAADEGEVSREVTFTYGTYYADIDGDDLAESFPVLNTITIPTFDPTLGSHEESPNTNIIDFDYVTTQFEHQNGPNTHTFFGPQLDSITFPEGPEFQFDQGSSGFLTSVTLPSGAQIEYGAARYPIGYTKWSWNSSRETEEPRVSPLAHSCGVNSAPALPPDVTYPDPLPPARSLSSPGVARRTITYKDASTATGTRQETTWFSQGLNCVGVSYFAGEHADTQWPYYFEPFLTDDTETKTEYLYTIVSHQAGFGSQGENTTSAEIHRFHPLSRTEFSIDYVEGPETEITKLYLNAVDYPYYGEGIGQNSPERADVRVIRHVEMEKEVILGAEDEKDLELTEDRYTFEKQNSTFTDTDPTRTPATQDVTLCYPMVTPGDPAPAITCTEVRQYTDQANVDDFLNIKRTTTQSFDSPEGLDITKVVETSFGYGGTFPGSTMDRYIWFLGLKNGEAVTENGSTTERAYFWQNLSEAADPDPVQRYYVVGKDTINPDAWTDTACTSGDCVRHIFSYDALGNRTGDTIDGGSGYGSGLFNPTTTTTYQHGKAVKKEISSATPSMLLWEREVDPSTGLTRWHVDGSGFGFAYLYDDTGRFTDIAPIDGDDAGARAVWDIDIQTTLINDTIAVMRGSHIEYVLPTTNTLFEHQVYDATWTTSSIDSEFQPGSFTPGSPRKAYLFDGLGRLTQEIEVYPQGQRSRFHVNYLHGASETCDADHSWDLTYKSRVNLDSEWVSGISFPECPTEGSWTTWTETQLDSLGRTARVYAPDGNIMSMTHHGDAQKTTTRSIADDISTTTGEASFEDYSVTTILDGVGRLRILNEEVDAATTYVTTYDYNERDQLTGVHLHIGDKDSASQDRTFEYWNTGFVKKTTEPERELHLLGYNATGSLTREETNDADVTVRHTYDGFGRLLNTKANDIEMIEQVWGNPHDGGGAVLGQPGYNRVVESIRHNRFETNVEVKHQWVFNGPGGRTSMRRTLISSLGDPDDGFQVNYGYDVWGNQNELIFPFFNGCRYSQWESVGKTFDGEWLTSTDIKSIGGAQEKTIGVLQYHPSGRILSLTYGNDLAEWSEEPDDNLMARPKRILLEINGVIEPAGVTGEYKYDGIGNIWQIGSKRYSYDGLNRLGEYSLWQAGRTLDFTEGYILDRWGNLTAIDRPVSRANRTPVNYLTFNFEDTNLDEVPDNNRIDSVSNTAKAVVDLIWDDRGNLKQQGAIADLRNKEYLWSFDDRLMQSTDDPDVTPTVWRFAYDAAGERVMKWYDHPAGLEATIYIRDEGGQVVSEWDYTVGGGSFDVSRDYISGGSTLAQIDHSGASESVEYFSVDHLGSTKVVFDDAGYVIDSMDYLPFGTLDGATEPLDATHLFTGHERDLGEASSELDYMHARYYSPTLARFVSVDPVSGDIGSSQSWNRYSYVENNPLMFVDPNGEVKVRAGRPPFWRHDGSWWWYSVKWEDTNSVINTIFGPAFGSEIEAVLDWMTGFEANDTSGVSLFSMDGRQADFETLVKGEFDKLTDADDSGNYSEKEILKLNDAVKAALNVWRLRGILTSQKQWEEVVAAYDAAAIIGKAKERKKGGELPTVQPIKRRKPNGKDWDDFQRYGPAGTIDR